MKFTFDQFVHYGQCHSNPSYLHGKNRMPWSFSFYGYPVTHENDDHYIISSESSGKSYNFRQGDYLTVKEDGALIINSPVDDIDATNRT